MAICAFRKQKKNDKSVTGAPVTSTTTTTTGNKTSTVTTTTTTTSSAAKGTGKCNLNFDALAKDMVIDKPIDISGCDKNSPEIKTLQQACNHNKNVMVIMRDNKTVKYHNVTPKIEINSFKCQSQGWSKPITENRFGTIDEWDSETHPTDAECANTCKAIKSVTDPKKNTFALNNPQCVKVCHSDVEKACNGLVDKKDGDKPITAIYKIIYKMESNNTFIYQCQFKY